jgi:hypothetical protein
VSKDFQMITNNNFEIISNSRILSSIPLLTHENLNAVTYNAIIFDYLSTLPARVIQQESSFLLLRRVSLLSRSQSVSQSALPVSCTKK